MTSDPHTEQAIINSFTLTYHALISGITQGAITPRQTLQLINDMASQFNNYATLQNASKEMLSTIDKVKNAG